MTKTLKQLEADLIFLVSASWLTPDTVMGKADKSVEHDQTLQAELLLSLTRTAMMSRMMKGTRISRAIRSIPWIYQ
jgi:hypothetical protein